MMDDLSEMAKGIHEIRIQKLKIGAVVAIPRNLLERMEIRASSDLYGEVLDRAIVSFRTWIDAGAHEEESVMFPATWWDHFKRDCFPAWALRRWPADAVTIARPKNVYVCPHSELKWPDRSHLNWIARTEP